MAHFKKPVTADWPLINALVNFTQTAPVGVSQSTLAVSEMERHTRR